MHKQFLTNNKTNSVSGSTAGTLVLQSYFKKLSGYDDTALSKNEESKIVKSIPDKGEEVNNYSQIMGMKSIREDLLFLQLFLDNQLLKAIQTCSHIFLHHGSLEIQSNPYEIKKAGKLEFEQSVPEFLIENFRNVYVLYELLNITANHYRFEELITEEIASNKQQLDQDLLLVLRIYGYKELQDLDICLTLEDMNRIMNKLEVTKLQSLNFGKLFEGILF